MLESGLIVFKLLEGNLSHTDVQLEVLMDDHLFPSYTSPKARSRHTVFGDGEYPFDVGIKRVVANS